VTKENSGHVLSNLAARLFERRREGIILRWADVSIGDWRPQRNECHANVTTWCHYQSAHQPIRGWLYFDLENLMPYVLFKPHSAVATEDGTLVDITPSVASRQYPFIVAEESEEEYRALVELRGIAELIHSK
jgi:hypothetical protein